VSAGEGASTGDVVSAGHWFEPVADHLGRAYLRYSHAKGTVQEVDHLVAVLGLTPGQRVLDVGCGPGRHAHELARRGIACHGIDVSERFVTLASDGAPPGATFSRMDARSLGESAEHEGAFDAAIALCQGAFGMSLDDGDDAVILAGIARAVRPGGRVALTAFNAYFAVRYHTAADFDADRGIAHEHTEVHDESGVVVPAELWTGCYTPRELRLLLGAHGLVVDSISSVEPGAYGAVPPTTESPEFLVLATKP